MNLYARVALTVVVAACSTLVAGCSETSDDVPDADAVITIMKSFNDNYPNGSADFFVAPTVGVGSQRLSTFLAPQGYTVVLRCLSDQRPNATIVDPDTAAATDAQPSEDLFGSMIKNNDRPCQGGTLSAQRPSTGGPVTVSVTAAPHTYWVAAVAKGNGTPKAPSN